MEEEEKYWLLFGKRLSGEISRAEAEELDSWLAGNPERAELQRQVEEDWNRSASYGEETSFDVDIAWNKLKGRMISQPRREAKILSMSWIRIAAAILIIFSFGIWTYRYYDAHQLITLSNQEQASQQYALPDGSKIWLKKGSSLSYEKGIADASKREIALSGEAFFEVRHNSSSPFIITADQTTTQVLGTSFNVEQNGEEVIVSVMTGKVSFKGGSEAMILLPGEQAMFSKNQTMQKRTFANTNFMFWKSGVLRFENEPLEKVLAALSEAYQVEFRIENSALAKQRITTNISRRPFTEIETLLELLLDARIEKKQNVYVVN